MLVLTQRIGQRILIGDNIEVKVLRISPKEGTVRLGFTAPIDIKIDREEVREAKLTGQPVSKCKKKKLEDSTPEAEQS